MSSKTALSLLAAHLQEHYRLPPAAAQTLSADLQRYGQLAGGQGRSDGQVLYHAVALGEPPGKPLRDCRKVPVRLTLFAESDLTLVRDQGRAALIQTVMDRLARDAIHQGASLTVEDLAWLLRISPRTVKRYRRRHGRPIRLRGDLTDAGPAKTHRDPIVKLFLLGYTETEIAVRCNHQLDAVEAYVYDFLRVALLAQEGKAPGTICRLVKLSRAKVKLIVALYQTLAEDDEFSEPLRHWLEVFALDRQMKKGEATR
jgi:DNA-binding CsgD family transcriptional regulator